MLNMSVNIGYSSYPKKRLLEVCTEYSQGKTPITIVKLQWPREGEEVPFYAMCYHDKKPMLIVSSCEVTLSSSTKTRHLYLEKNAVVHCSWLLEQLHLMVVYRLNNNTIDQLNQEAPGHMSICEAIGIKSC